MNYFHNFYQQYSCNYKNKECDKFGYDGMNANVSTCVKFKDDGIDNRCASDSDNVPKRELVSDEDHKNSG